MEGFNPWIDVAICFGFLAVLAGVCFIGDKYFPIKKQPAPRGATRV